MDDKILTSLKKASSLTGVSTWSSRIILMAYFFWFSKSNASLTLEGEKKVRGGIRERFILCIATFTDSLKNFVSVVKR